MANSNKNFIVITHYSFAFPDVKIFNDEVEAVNHFMKSILGETKAIKDGGNDYDFVIEKNYAKITVENLDGTDITEFYIVEVDKEELNRIHNL